MMLPVVAPGAGAGLSCRSPAMKTDDAGCMAALPRGRREGAGTGAIGTADTRLPTKR